MKHKLYFPVFLLVLFASCTKENLQVNKEVQQSKDITNQQRQTAVQKEGIASKAIPYMAEYITDANSGKIGQTIYFKNVGNKHFGVSFVAADPRRGGRLNITYAVDNETTTDNGITLAQTEAAIDNAMATWDAVKCSDLNITKIPYPGNLGLYSYLTGFGGSTDVVADIQHSGFLPPAFFDTFAPGGGSFILGITIPFVFTDDAGNPTDIDNNGELDYAFAEIYYNDGFVWRTNSGSGVDLQSIALHESGHGLGQAHFGKAFSTGANGKLHFAPQAVMNAGYFGGEQRTLMGSDSGGFCSIWANWPKN